MHVDADALSATGGVLARQQAHLDATRRYLDVVCDRPGALVGVLALFRGSYADAVAASTRGLADAARLARGLERAVTDFRDDVLEVDTGTAARFARTERMLHGADPAGGVNGSGADGGAVGSAGAVGTAGAPWAGPSGAPLGAPGPSTGLARVLSAHLVAEGTGATGADLSPTSSDADPGRARSSAAATLGAVRGLHAQVGDVSDAVHGLEVGLGEALHGLADLDTYAAFTADPAGSTGASAASLADRLGATA